MRTIQNIAELSRFVSDYCKLQKICSSLQRSHENACKYGLTNRQETRERNLMKEAQEIAKRFGLVVYEQGDPRGCALYLLDEGIKNPDSEYTDGIAVI